MQAFLITAYKNPEYLSQLINSLTKHGGSVYVHIDAKADFDAHDVNTTLYSSKHVHIYKQYSIQWGSINHLYAILMLLNKALENPDNQYFHSISGQDILVRYPDSTKLDKCIFMTCTKVDSSNPMLIRRQRQYNLFPNTDTRQFLPRVLNLSLWCLQHITHIWHRPFSEYTQLYKGMVWVSIPREAAEYVSNYVNEHSQDLQTLRHTLLPEEFFFQTVLMNSSWRDKIVTNNLRFTDWHRKGANGPAILDESDYPAIMSTNCCFARKIDPVKSANLIEMIDAHASNS